ncbi:MAG: hypothetical protein NT171_06895 [Planctomycetota bacterium]|nr:hypothetical protein [Planctomycetota bacterium]
MSVQTASAGAPPRKLFPWSRSATAKAPPADAASKTPAAGKTAPGKTAAKPKHGREPRRPFDYSPEARPEQQGALATILPTRPSRLGVALVGIVVVTATTLILGGWPAAIETIGRFAGARFTRTVAVLRELLDLRGLVLGGWLAQMFLLGAASVALSIRGMRRHRKDARCGRSRAWLAMAIVLTVASMAGTLPIGKLVSTFLVEATGRSFGPEGFGWWVAIAGSVTGIVTLWILLPLHQRLVPGFWLLLGLAGWSAAAAVPRLGGIGWVGAGQNDLALAGAGAWVVGSAAMLAAMLTAARGVIREVRGEIKAPPVGTAKDERGPKVVKTEAVTRQAKAPEPVFEPVDTDDDGAPQSAAEGSETGYTDGSDAEDEYASRPLSKAEKKRLRKMGRHAA